MPDGILVYHNQYNKASTSVGYNDDLSSDGVMHHGGGGVFGGAFINGHDEVLELPMEGADIDLCPQKFMMSGT